MKKMLTIILASILVISLAACGGGSNSGSATQAPSPAGQTASGSSGQKESGGGSASEADSNGREETEGSPEKTTDKQEGVPAAPDMDFSATIEETVLVDDMGVKITATGLSYSSSQAQLGLKIENNSDRDLTFLAGNSGYPLISVNGYMITEGYMNEDVAAGMAANEKIRFNLEELTLYGFSDIAEIGIGFEIKEDSSDYLLTDMITIKTSADPGYDYGADTFAAAMANPAVTSLYGITMDSVSDEVIFDNAGVSVINEYICTNKDGEKILFMEVKNSSDADVITSTGYIRINGIAVSSGTWDSDYIAAGKRAVMSIVLDNVLEPALKDALGIDEYGSIGFTFAVRDAEFSEIASSVLSIDAGNAAASGFDGEVLYAENNITIMYAGLVEDRYDFSNDKIALYVVRNDNDFEIRVEDSGDAYVDKMKIGSLSLGTYIQPGETALVDIELDGDDMEDNGFEIGGISELTVMFEIKDEMYRDIAEPAVTKTF